MLIIGMVGGANATPVKWNSGTGANSHWYDVVTCTNSITWDNARLAAASTGWHLVTITSAEEDRFVAGLLSTQMTTLAENYWLGGYQPSGSSEPLGGWSWVTGEAWSYAHWYAGEPNNGAGGTQHYLHYWPAGTWQWDDMENRNTMVGYVMEQNPVPEPATMVLFGLGVICLAMIRGRGKK